MRNKSEKNVENGVTGVTGLVSLTHVKIWVTPWCNRGVTGVTVKPT